MNRSQRVWAVLALLATLILMLLGSSLPAAAAAGDVQVGTALRHLDGTNIYRTTNFLVRYTGTAKSPANEWGYEVSVSSAGKVLAISDGKVGMAIPTGGSVLSGHGTSATWLRTNGKVGATVVWPGGAPPPTTAPPTTAPPTTAPPGGPATQVTVNGKVHALNGTNVPREAGWLVRYTGTTSPANQWGVEAAVSSAGKVTQVQSYKVGMAIPAGGSVLSGHDASADWLLANAPVGATVAFNGGTPTTPPPTDPPTTPPDTGLALTGRWTQAPTNMTARAMHATLLRDGRVLLLAGSGNNYDDFAAGTFKANIWNPANNSITQLNTPSDMFCSGHVTLPDGRVLIQGGTASYAGDPAGEAFRGLRTSYIFNPANNTFTKTNDTIEGHWYPTLTKIENGDIWAAGGYTHKAGGGPALSTEMFSGGAWKTAANVPQTNRYWGTYPHMFLMADGRMFYTGGHTFGEPQPGSGALIYNWRTKQIGDIPGLRDKDLRDQAGSVLLPPAQNQTFMIAGGGSTDNGGSTNSVDLVNMNAANPAYHAGPALPGAEGRIYVNLTTLPNRTVLASNGSTETRDGDVLKAGTYNPETNEWTEVDADPIGRNYHSAAVLLPDGRVAVFGSNPADGSYELRISVYEPGYLFKGTRPTVTAPATATYGQTLNLGVTGQVASASLTSPTSSTHQTDTNARLIDLPMTGTGASRSVTVPANSALVPPGPYMLTVLDVNGVPSIAKWVNVQ